MTDQFSLDGRRILVTGGTRGIGQAISLQLARGGAHVIANYVRNDATAKELMEIAEKDSLSISTCRADLTSPKGLEHLMNAVIEEDLEGLVHCAATGIHRQVEETTARHWDFTFALNVKAFYQIATALLFKFSPGASVVALSSEGAVHAFPAYALVGSSKGALESLCRHLAVEWASREIRVNVLSPGSVITQAWDAFPEKEERIRAAVERSPRGRLTTPEEVALCAHFLCSNASAGMNGHTLVVDGGQRIRG